MQKNLRSRLYEIIFETETKEGKLFDIVILIAIVLSIATVMGESVPLLRKRYSTGFIRMEWFFTVIFGIEYLLRIYSARDRLKYVFSFFGVVDMLAILPSFAGIFIVGVRSLLVIRAFRLLRIFRILKISRYLRAGEILKDALISSREKIGIFLFAVFMVIIFVGTLMYLIEGEVHGFTSIPKSLYWAVVTLTTVGYGDITPQTGIGQFLSALLMITGYAIIAVPTGIISAELVRSEKKSAEARICTHCGRAGHTKNAVYCYHCGGKI